MRAAAEVARQHVDTPVDGHSLARCRSAKAAKGLLGTGLDGEDGSRAREVASDLVVPRLGQLVYFSVVVVVRLASSFNGHLSGAVCVSGGSARVRTDATLGMKASGRGARSVAGRRRSAWNSVSRGLALLGSHRGTLHAGTATGLRGSAHAVQWKDVGERRAVGKTAPTTGTVGPEEVLFVGRTRRGRLVVTQALSARRAGRVRGRLVVTHALSAGRDGRVRTHARRAVPEGGTGPHSRTRGRASPFSLTRPADAEWSRYSDP